MTSLAGSAGAPDVELGVRPASRKQSKWDLVRSTVDMEEMQSHSLEGGAGHAASGLGGDDLLQAAQLVYKAHKGHSLNFTPAPKRTFMSGPPERPKPAKIYDPKNNLGNLFVWSGTAVRLVFFKPDFWFLTCLHVVFVILYHGVYGYADNIKDSPWPPVKADTMLIVGSLLVFFMIFFNGQAYSRFFSQYFLCRKIQFNVQDLFFLARTHLDSPLKQLCVLRFLVATHYLGFAYLPQNRDLPGFVSGVFDHLVTTKTLTQGEMEDLVSCDASVIRHEEPLLWCIQILRKEMNDGYMKPPIFRAFEAKIHAINDEFEELHAYALQPIPFAYYHLMAMMCAVYLLTLSYTAMSITPFFSIVGYVVSLVALIGLREASGCLSDPLGTDESDIPIFEMIAEQHFQNIRILTTRPTKDVILDPVSGFGSVQALKEVLKGISPADFQYDEGNLAEIEERTREMSSKMNEHVRFWMDLAAGRMTKVSLKMSSEEEIKEPPAESPDDDDDDAEDFEVPI